MPPPLMLRPPLRCHRHPAEVDRKDYIFISKEEFLGMVEWEELLEYALVYGDYKGMLK